MPRQYNRARMTTATTGTGTVTLGSAVTAFATFAEAGVPNATEVTYCIEDGNDFEIGRGVYTTSGTTLTRATVLLSKISGTAGTSKINLSGTATVFITAAAEDFHQFSANVDFNGFNADFDDATGIRDDSGNEQLIFKKTASAVSQWQMTNAATGNGPILEPEGEANISPILRGKGTGVPIAASGEPYLTGGSHVVGYWPARAMIRPTTTPAGAVASTESSTNDVMDEYSEFANGSTTHLQFAFRAPKMLNEASTFIVEFEWMEASGAGSHVCRWQAEMQAQGDGDTIDSAWGTAVAVDDTGSSGTRRFIQTAAVTPAGTWAVGDKIIVRLARLGGHANDSLDVAARLIGVTLFAAVNKRNEA